MIDLTSLAPLAGHKVRINRGGPESIEGVLLAVKTDYVSVWKPGEGVVHFQGEHLKSVTQDGKDPGPVEALMPPASSAELFADLLEELKYAMVKINRGGPESVQGILAESTGDMAILIAQNEIITKFVFHIQSLSQVVKEENEEGENAEGNNEQAGRSSSRSSRSSSSSKKKR